MALKNGSILKIYEIYIENLTPLHIGGDNDELLIDKEKNEIYLPGTTIAGALRSYLKTIGFEKVDKLFGVVEGNKNLLSRIFVYDSFSPLKSMDIRSGVKIDRFSGAASDKAKFERSYAGEGHEFTLKLEVYADTEKDYEDYNSAVYSCIKAIAAGNITLGAYKTSGAGRFKVKEIKELFFHLNKKEDLFSYLKNSKDYVKKSIEDIEVKNDYNTAFIEYELKGETLTPLLIKGMSTLDHTRSDSEGIKNVRGEYIIPGTSLKGVIRSHGERILKYYKKEAYGDMIFGGTNNTKSISKFIAFDSSLMKCREELYSRIKVDRFAGSVMKGQKPEETLITGEVNIKGALRPIEIKDNKEINEEAAALIALIFRDIALGELPLGSGSSVGRGRIKGRELIIKKDEEVLYRWNLDNDSPDINKIDKYIEVLAARGER
ncbi:RAMP superfamily CRISPR-associated protein [Clostridium polynesiense]|uniref:RAMP superfamily CRISPR-associated protein n=1 Tax=Clostridium polynesiense TaxID=1325933 RepID=UPI00059081E8|nr:RAMP superfamily CRISPR-associated protein [Clostridium polynesiense]